MCLESKALHLSVVLAQLKRMESQLRGRPVMHSSGPLQSETTIQAKTNEILQLLWQESLDSLNLCHTLKPLPFQSLNTHSSNPLQPTHSKTADQPGGYTKASVKHLHLQLRTSSESEKHETEPTSIRTEPSPPKRPRTTAPLPSLLRHK